MYDYYGQQSNYGYLFGRRNDDDRRQGCLLAAARHQVKGLGL